MAKKKLLILAIVSSNYSQGFFPSVFSSSLWTVLSFFKKLFLVKNISHTQIKKKHPPPPVFFVIQYNYSMSCTKNCSTLRFCFFEHNKFSRAWCIYIKCLYILMPILLSMEYYVLKSTTIQKYLFWIMHPTIQLGALSKRELRVKYGLTLFQTEYKTQS